VIFWLETVYLIGLGVLGAAYVVDWIDPRSEIGALPTPVLWFGALGAVLLSLSGVFDHPYDWDDGYLLWHIARPLVGAAVAVVAVLIVIAGILAVGTTPDPAPSTVAKTTDIFYYLVAFLVGYREESFRLMVKRLGDVVLQPADTVSAPTITEVAPRTGGAGDTVTITGTGLAQTRVVKFGTEPARRIEKASDVSLTAIVPPGQAGSEVVVAVSTPGGSASAPMPFTYRAD
jgi:hypothetical protein